MAKLLLLHAPHVVPRFSSSNRPLISASALYRRPLLVNPQLSHIGPRLHSPYNRRFSARAFDGSPASSSAEIEKEQQEQRQDGVSRERDEDYPTGEMEYENRNAWEIFVVKLRMLFAFPWQRVRKGSVLTMTLRGQVSLFASSSLLIRVVGFR